MHALAIAGVVEDRRRRTCAAERGVVSHIGPQSAHIGLALGQDRNGRVVAVQALGGQDMGLDALDQRRQDRGHAADLVGQGREAERYALAGIALGLAIKRLMGPKLLEDDHGQQAGAGPAAGKDMEGGWSLGDGLAVSAGDLLANGLDHLPLAGDHLQRLGDVLAELGQARATAAGAGLGGLDHDALARQMLWERLTRGLLAGEGLDRGRGPSRGLLGGELVLGGAGLQLFQLQLQLVKQTAGPLRRRPEPLTLELGDLQLQMGDERLIVGDLGLGGGGVGPGHVQLLTHDQQRRLKRFDVVRQGLQGCIHRVMESQIPQLVAPLNAGQEKKMQGLSSTGRAPGVLGITPVDALQHVAELGRRQSHRATLRRRPDEPPTVQALGVERHAQAIVPDDLDQASAAATEHKQITRMRVALQVLLDQQS